MSSSHPPQHGQGTWKKSKFSKWKGNSLKKMKREKKCKRKEKGALNVVISSSSACTISPSTGLAGPDEYSHRAVLSGFRSQNRLQPFPHMRKMNPWELSELFIQKRKDEAWMGRPLADFCRAEKDSSGTMNLTSRTQNAHRDSNSSILWISFFFRKKREANLWIWSRWSEKFC